MSSSLTGCLLLLFLACGCGGVMQDAGLRAAAAKQLACDESHLDGESLGPRTVRVSGCGKSALFSCQQVSTGERGGGAPPDENSARYDSNYNTGELPCSWDVVK